MSTTVFSSGDDVIQRKIDVQYNAVQKNNLNEVYEIDKCVSWVKQNGFKRVALQFPDELLTDAARVVGQIQSRISDGAVFILGDTSYGSCCVDEILAQHYSADSIIHFGNACLSPTSRLPVLYIFGRAEIDVTDCVHQLTGLCPDADMKAVIVYDTIISYKIDEIYSELRHSFAKLVFSTLSIPSYSSQNSTNQHVQFNDYSSTSLSDTVTVNPLSEEASLQSQKIAGDSCFSLISYCGRNIHLSAVEDISNYSFIFIGDTERTTLTHFMLRFNKCTFYSYNHRKKTCHKELLNINKALMKRYYLIERAKDANIVGIVVGTLGVAKYRNVVEHLKVLLKKAGKKSYTFVVGKLNPAKLANFAEVDIYVLVACPESTLFDQTEFYRPIVSPLEIEIACNQAREWTGEYSTDFTEILKGTSLHVEGLDSGSSESFKTDVSLISNHLRVVGIKEELAPCSKSNQDLVLRSEEMAITSVAENAGQYLANRTWKGLEQKLGETPVTKAREGQSGIAASYTHEPGGS